VKHKVLCWPGHVAMVGETTTFFRKRPFGTP
jgi:hypothetical protein